MASTSTDLIIASRCTSKTLGNIDEPFIAPPEFDVLVSEAIEVSQWAPFHYPCHKSHCEDGSAILPWRFYHLNSASCNALISKLAEIGKRNPEKSTWSSAGTGKVEQMLAAAGAMIQITWLPDPPFQNSTKEKERELQKRNTEHLAAAGAAVQNLLLSLESKGLNSYWSSGGRLREPLVFDLLEIPHEQKILACIFVYPRDQEHVEILAGKLRDKRGETKDWCKEVKLDT